MSQLILVNEKDDVMGYGEKMPVHINGELHRAFSVFIWDEDKKKLLIQKRAETKYHSGGKWSNSCCSHPYKGENIEEAVKRCVFDELGNCPNLTNKVKVLSKFIYKSDYNGIYEHEIDYVIVLFSNEENFPENKYNTAEISEIKWVTINELNEFFLKDKSLFSSWFEQAYHIFLREGPACVSDVIIAFLHKLYNSCMWFSKSKLEQFVEIIKNDVFPPDILMMSENDLFQNIYAREISCFKRNFMMTKNHVNYYNFKTKLFPIQQMSKILVTCKYKYQHLVGTYKVYIFPYYNNGYSEGDHLKPYSCTVEAVNNCLTIPYEFESEDMYCINIFYCHENEELPFISDMVYALDNDLYNLNPYKADFHMHTTYSDGIESPEFTVASAIENGMDIVAITDHNNFSGSLAARKFVNENNIDVTVILGEEYSLAFSPMHILALGTDKAIDRKYIGSAADKTVEAQQLFAEIEYMNLRCDKRAYVCTQVLLDKVKAMGGVTFLAHPFWKPIGHKGERMDTPESLFIELAKDKRFTGLEVVSGSPDLECSISNLQMSIASEMSGNMQGMPLIGITDSHHYSQDNISGKHYTIVFSESRNEKAVLNALESGMCVAVEMVNSEPLCYGKYRYVKYAHFLVQHYFKEHDENSMFLGKQIKKKYLTVDNEVD